VVLLILGLLAKRALLRTRERMMEKQEEWRESSPYLFGTIMCFYAAYEGFNELLASDGLEESGIKAKILISMAQIISTMTENFDVRN
jgi:hypothetical protein